MRLRVAGTFLDVSEFRRMRTPDLAVDVPFLRGPVARSCVVRAKGGWAIRARLRPDPKRDASLRS
jgi:hypothetical protein